MKQILCFGDSNTYGLIPGLGGRYSVETRWTGKLNEKVSAFGYRVIEEGLCGRTTVFEDELRAGRRGIDFLPVLLESHYPVDYVVLMLGTNDCKTVYGASAEVIGKGIERLLQQIRAADSGIKVLLVSPIWLGEEVWKDEFDPEFDRKSIQTSMRLKSVYAKLAEKYGCSFLAASDIAAPSGADQQHLDERGHELLAEAVFEKLHKELCKENAGIA